jgi:hypothetical protein
MRGGLRMGEVGSDGGGDGTPAIMGAHGGGDARGGSSGGDGRGGWGCRGRWASPHIALVVMMICFLHYHHALM